MKPTVLTCDNQVKILHPGGSHKTWEVPLLYGQSERDIVLFEHYVHLKGEWDTTGVLVVLADGKIVFSWEVKEVKDSEASCLYWQECQPFVRRPFALQACDIKEDEISLRFVDGDELELKIQHDSGSPLRTVVRSIPWLYLRDGFIPQQRQDK